MAGRPSPITRRRTPFDDDKWELYHLDKDFSESRDLAAVAAGEARRNGLICGGRRPAATACCRSTIAASSCGRRRRRAFNPRNRDRYVYRPPIDFIPGEVGARRSATARSPITADIERPKAETEGVLLSFGDAKSGFAFYVLKDRLVFDYNLFATHYRAVSDVGAAGGAHAGQSPR